jgi:hypothetical protein
MLVALLIVLALAVPVAVLAFAPRRHQAGGLGASALALLAGLLPALGLIPALTRNDEDEDVRRDRAFVAGALGLALLLVVAWVALV